MAQLAIKGHPIRGREVIQLLEMLGGKNIHNYVGTSNECYAIDDNKICTIYTSVAKIDNCVIFTLEEFEKLYPYKVGDDVITKSNNVYKINDIMWDNEEIVYSLTDGNSITCWYNTAELRPYKEENIEGVYAYNEINCYHQDFGNKVRIRLGNDFEIKVEDNITYIVKKQPQYPKSFVECALLLNTFYASYIEGYKNNLLIQFQKLLICRDAYWKIAGEQMGLGKPWEPKHEYDEEIFFIYCDRVNGINKGQGFPTDNFCLCFPTKEMRDAFKENFKELIEQCKELL